MITVQEADRIISQNIKKSPAVPVPLEDAYGMVLREDLLTDRDVPPFDRVMMDGIGIDFKAWERGNRIFPIYGIQRAGIQALKLKNNNGCLEVMTGAVVPDGCNCIIPYEDIEIKDGQAHIRENVETCCGKYIHAKGSDYLRGARLVSKGVRLLAPQVAVAASMGKAEVLVSARPKIAAVGTGDEVVDIRNKVEPHQIRQSNAYVIQAALQLAGHGRVSRFHVKDNKNELKKTFTKLLEGFDVIILSGGVSMGKFDYVPDVLAGLGVRALFHQVKQRPGKPFWFGISENRKPVFGLPGNPVATLVGIYRYVLPYLDAAQNAFPQENEYALLNKNIDVGTDRAYFLPVKAASKEDGRLWADPLMPHNSGDYAAVTRADGFLELPQDVICFPEGTSARFYRWKI